MKKRINRSLEKFNFKSKKLLNTLVVYKPVHETTHMKSNEWVQKPK